ncbi:hypothetical protein GEMRC1_004894 [Eukaryota sp. GEM-RC1]
MGVYVSLLEYDSIQGMILPSEVTRKRARTLAAHIRVGRQECAAVLRVDAEKGYIDLSKRRVDGPDIKKCEEKFYKGRAVQNIFSNVAQSLKVDLAELLETIGWPLYENHKHAFDAFTKYINGQDVFAELLQENPDTPKAWIEAVKQRVDQVMAPHAAKIRTEFELTCSAFEGVEAIKAALKAGVAVGESDEIEAKLIAPPLYVLTLTSEQKDNAIERLKTALVAVETEIVKYGGSLTIKTPPRVVSQHDDRMLQQMMAQAERENREVSGDQTEE